MSQPRNTAARRMFALLDLLVDAEWHRMDDLAAECGVSTRTIRRDVYALNQCGFHIRFAAFPDHRNVIRTSFQIFEPERVRAFTELRKVAC